MIRAGALLAAALVLAGPAARAQTYPSKPITLIIPFAPGGSNDIVGRAIGKKLTEAWGQPVVVENRGGGGTIIGTTAVATAPPDGYTLLLVSPTFTINPAVRKSLPFDPVRDFTPIAFIARAPLLVTTSNKLPVQSARELFALARSKPGQITYASAGMGSINQISTEQIALSAGVKLMHVPYKGGAPALNDLVGGHVDMFVSSVPQALQLVRGGQVKTLAVTSTKRTALLPDVPTLAESGETGAELGTWWGIVGPAGLPADIVNALNKEIAKMLASPELGIFFANEGAESETMTPQQFGDMMRLETARWTKVAHEAHISID
ncbi:MAG: tripartite tricarboxylate transporter substrate binding protein [Rhizobiales bacterium]|nr:tripartite tricarboxylate transporter substrate binding protein [Hyphomicrobiales bacterium]